MKQEPKNVLDTPEAASLMGDAAALKELLGSPETRQLLSVLSAQNGAALQEAAQQARGGDTSRLSAMLSGLGSTRDGAAALEQMERKLNRR